MKGCLYCSCAHESLLSVDRFTVQFGAQLRQGSGTACFTMTLDTEEITIPLVKEGGLFYPQDPYAEETCCYQDCQALPEEVFPCSAPMCELAACEHHGEYDRHHGIYKCYFCKGCDVDRLEQCERGAGSDG